MTTATSLSELATVGPASRLRGELRLPGDKSVSHRALMLATLAAGESRIAERRLCRLTIGMMPGTIGTVMPAARALSTNEK